MTEAEHIQTIKILLNGLAEYLQVNLTVDQLRMYAEDLSDLSLPEVKSMISAFRNSQTEHYGKFPLPAALKALVRPQASSRDIAHDTAGKIWEAIAKYGQYNAEEAKANLGDIAWQTVLRLGGWVSVCATPSDERGIFFAQCRDITESVQRLSMAGILGHKHALPRPPSERIENQYTKQITSGNGDA